MMQDFSSILIPATGTAQGAHPFSCGSLKKKLIFDSSLWWCGPLRIVRHRHVPAVDMGNDLIPEGEESLPVGNFIFMDMGRRDSKGIVPLRGDFIMDVVPAIHLYEEQQHVEMQ